MNKPVKEIKERNRIALAMLELAKDKVFYSIPAEERLRLIEEVLSVGDDVAKWVMAEYQTSDPRKIAELMGVRVYGADHGQLKKSEYRTHKNEIVIYRDALSHLTKEVTVPHLSERILRFLVAHELFHHLEATRIGTVYKRFKFPGPFGMKRYIKGFSEVAAQAFTQTLLSLEFSPQVFDYLTYVLFTSDFKS